MSNSPYDPKTPLYQGQAIQQQNAGSGFHFLEAAGHAAMALGRFFGSGDDDAEEVEEQPQRRPRPRAARVGRGTCCRAKRPAPTEK